MDPAKSPIFIVGNGRSGTTLLQLMMCAHPRIFVAFESNFYVCRANLPPATFLENYLHNPAFRWLGVDPARVRAALPDPLPPERTSEAFVAILREAAAIRGRVRFGDKSPLHAQHLGQIFADFPDARVIYIVRDPRATALSQSRMPWCPPTIYAGALTCAMSEHWIAPFRDRMLTVRFEDLVAEPRAQMARVLEHVGEPWDDAVLDHPRHLPPNPTPPWPWIESASGERRAEATPSWKSLTPLQIRQIEIVAKKTMQAQGYAPADLPVGTLAALWANLREVPRSISGALKLRRLATLQRDWRVFYDGRYEAAARAINPAAWARWPQFKMPAPPDWRALPEHAA